VGKTRLARFDLSIKEKGICVLFYYKRKKIVENYGLLAGSLQYRVQGLGGVCQCQHFHIRTSVEHYGRNLSKDTRKDNTLILTRKSTELFEINASNI